MLRLECVTVSVGYGDFLAAVAPFNLVHLDRWLIVTEPSDLETREVARRLNLEVLLTEDGHRDGSEFAKGRMIERGLQHLSADSWRLHLDGDVVLPAFTRRLLEAAELDPACIYGCDRVLVRSWEQWQRLLASGWLQGSHHDYQNRIRWPEGFPVGARWASLATGWCPVGFLQLHHSSSELWRGARIRPYPSAHNDACRTDVQHSLSFDRRRRALLPEVIVAHLESEAGGLGINWRGRVTRRFGPPLAAPGGAGPS